MQLKNVISFLFLFFLNSEKTFFENLTLTLLWNFKAVPIFQNVI